MTTMYKSVPAAETAAYEGHGGQEFDTQACNQIADIFSSSPERPPPPGIASTLNDASIAFPKKLIVADVDTGGAATEEREEDEDEDENATEVDVQFILEREPSPPLPVPPHNSFVEPSATRRASVASNTSRRVSESSSTSNAEINSQGARYVLRRNAEGQLRKVLKGAEETPKQGEETPKEEEPSKGVGSPATQAKRFLATMDLDNTQKSNMSLTQENSSSAYENLDIQRYHLPQTSPPGSSPPQLEGERHTQASLWRQQHSTRTDSTAHTYKENDTGHIQLTYDPESQYDEPESQDASYAKPQLIDDESLHSHPLPPETPAPPINPFANKGSVLKVGEMFGATQPSVGRAHASPTSTRPSPDVYNDFTSPPKARTRAMPPSSPLARRQDIEDRADENPLQSSVRKLMAQSMTIESPQSSSRASGIQSFQGRTLQRTNSLPEPRKYSSMKESQERRKQELLAARSNWDPNDSDSDAEDDHRSRRFQREKAIQRQLSAVELPPAMSSRGRSSSAKMENATAQRLGRRRSTQDDYVAQCSGFDARDTQTQPEDQETQADDIIADSQSGHNGAGEPDSLLQNTSLVSQPNDPEMREDIVRASLPAIENLRSSENTPQGSERVPATETETELADQESTPADEPSKEDPEPSLPLQRIDPNRNNLQTPVASKNQVFSDGANDAVPETSPADDRLRPMGDIGGVSFDGDGDDDEILQNLPGFSQDVDFLRAIKEPVIPPPLLPLPKPRSKASLSPPNFENSAVVEKSVSASPLQQELLRSSPPVIARTKRGVQFTEDGDNAEPAMNHQQEQTNSKPDNEAEDQGGTMDGDDVVMADTADVAGDGQTKAQQEPTASTDATRDHLNDQEQADDGVPDVAQPDPNEPKGPEEPEPKRELRTKSELKGPSRDLRRVEDTPVSNIPVPREVATPREATPEAVLDVTEIPLPLSKSPKKPIATYSKKRTSVAKNAKEKPKEIPKETPKETPRSTPQPEATTSMSAAPSTRSSRRQASAKQENHTPARLPPKRVSKRKSGVISVEEDEAPEASRPLKRQSTARPARESSDDPLTLPSASTTKGKRSTQGLFGGMVFAVSYVKHEQEKDAVAAIISDNGGEILPDGFDGLFAVSHPKEEEAQLMLTEQAKSTGFVALIADEHSRKPKYMQALALGLPSISGKWISACKSQGTIVDWTPYLLCAGQSTFLHNAHLSRKLQPYSAADATLETTFGVRSKMLEGKSILVVMGKGKADEKRTIFMFLTRASGPSRIGQVADYAEARKELLDSEASEREWDILYIDAKDKTKEKAAESAVFGPSTGGGSQKRKRGPAEPRPRKIRVITDEVVVQSLIFGRLVDEE